MNINDIFDFLNEYGILILFVVILLEYMNLPGFPAGVILPISGVWAYNSKENIIIVIIISVLAGTIGSLVLYYIGKYGGEKLLKRYMCKFPSQKPIIDKCTNKLNKYGNQAIFISKLLPCVRTIIGIPAGVINMKLKDYVMYSALGIILWNGMFILAGYFFSETVLKYL